MSDWRIALLKNYAFVSKLVAIKTNTEREVNAAETET